MCGALEERRDSIMLGLDGLVIWAPNVVSGELRRVVLAAAETSPILTAALAGGARAPTAARGKFIRSDTGVMDQSRWSVRRRRGHQAGRHEPRHGLCGGLSRQDKSQATEPEERSIVTETTGSDPALLLRAATFSADRHRDQRRKGVDASPYINHPLAVANVLANVGGVSDIEILVAALLHDTIEDTGTSPEELENLFGRGVCRLVQEVSDDKGLPKAERKRLQIEHAASLSAAAKQLKLGDKTLNVHDVVENPPGDWPLSRRREYLDWAEAVVAGCRGVNEPLERYFDQLVAEGRAALQHKA
jgi:hypothetical protein